MLERPDKAKKVSDQDFTGLPLLLLRLEMQYRSWAQDINDIKMRRFVYRSHLIVTMEQEGILSTFSQS